MSDCDCQASCDVTLFLSEFFPWQPFAIIMVLLTPLFHCQDASWGDVIVGRSLWNHLEQVNVQKQT